MGKPSKPVTVDKLRQSKVTAFWRQYQKRDEIVERFRNDPDAYDEDMQDCFQTTETVCMMLGFKAEDRMIKKVNRKHDFLSKRQRIVCVPAPYLKNAKPEDFAVLNPKPRCHQFHGKFASVTLEGTSWLSLHHVICQSNSRFDVPFRSTTRCL